MPESLTDAYARLPLEQIYVERRERQRRVIDTSGLKDSIAARGVLNPVIVERATGPGGLHKLVAGERRYKACQELGLADVPVRFADTLPPIEAQIIELEENIKRADLTWQDRALAVQRINLLYSETAAQRGESWTQERTAQSLSITPGMASMSIRAAIEIEKGNESVKAATSLDTAYNIVKRRDKREYALTMDELHNSPISLDGAPEPKDEYDFAVGDNPAKNILLEDFVHWASKYRGPAFNFIHCDFPYGINVFEGPQAGGERHHSYDDSKEIHFKLLETLLVNFNRLASSSCHVMFWFSMQHYDTIRAMVREIVPDLIIQTHPLIWLKSDSSGIASDPQRGPRHVYETALLMSRGDRNIVRVVNDAYAAPTDREFHIHTKPEPMLRHFFTMLVDHTTIMLDPTCGGGSAIRAAESLGATRVVGMDTDETTVSMARTALRQSRALRTANILTI